MQSSRACCNMIRLLATLAFYSSFYAKCTTVAVDLARVRASFQSSCEIAVASGYCRDAIYKSTYCEQTRTHSLSGFTAFLRLLFDLCCYYA
jgi:hypothetical protein